MTVHRVGLVQVGLGPAHLVLLAGLLTASGPGIHTCILSANQLGGLSKHAGQTSSIEETGKWEILNIKIS